MSALTADIPTTRFGVPGDGHQPLSAPLQLAQKVYGGSVATTWKGYLVAPSTPSSDLIVLGIIQRFVDNSTGASGDQTAQIETGTFFLFGGTGADALSQAYVGQVVYLVDEKTVAPGAAGTRPVAGTLRAIDTTRAGGDYYAVTLGTVASGDNVSP